jgi:Ca2+/H+ antiporter
MIEQWTPISLLIFMSVLIILVYAVGVWIGTHLEKTLQADKLKADKKAAEDKKVPNTRRR